MINLYIPETGSWLPIFRKHKIVSQCAAQTAIKCGTTRELRNKPPTNAMLCCNHLLCSVKWMYVQSFWFSINRLIHIVVSYLVLSARIWVLFISLYILFNITNIYVGIYTRIVYTYILAFKTLFVSNQWRSEDKYLVFESK